MTDIVTVLKRVAPRANPAFLKASGAAGSIMEVNNILSVEAQAQLIAHMAHETMGFTRFEELMTYSAKRLTQVWPSRFSSLAAAQPYANNPKALANKVYGTRMGNRGGDDGWNFRGSGALQHTGYGEFDRVKRRTNVNVLATPQRLRDPAAAAVMWQAACTYVNDRPGLLAAFNRGDVRDGRKKINGGVIGLGDVEVLYRRSLAALKGQPIDAKTKTTTETADDDKRKAGKGTVAAPAGGAAGGAGSATQTDYTTAIMIGVGIAIALGIVAVVLWKRVARSRETVERMRLQQIQVKAELAP